jgi:hypothetical protein
VDGAVGLVGNPARQVQRRRLAKDEVAEADAVDAPGDPGVEPLADG